MKNLLTVLLALVISTSIFSQGKVYIVLGSDTSIWEGLNTSKHYHYYKHGLYTDQSRNAYKVMDPAWRSQMVDSYGTPMKMTWWIMAGNTFRYAINTNVPDPNSIIFYYFKKYHGENASILGDEITLHYHNFVWTDYDQDGVYYWNQALHWDDYKEDFEYTLCQLLIDEDVFPVSFRGGWHFMENEWQHYFEDVLPFSMHNDYPANRYVTEEPINNIYNWSMAPSSWEPYHPADSNYQVPGELKGWELRSKYMKSFNSSYIETMFQNALNGQDQMACVWSHLPEADFPEQMLRVDSLMHVVAANYPTVKFQYCSAIEAMQEWMKTHDTHSPSVTISEEESGEDLYFQISVNEFIFQGEPFVAVKDIYERYTRLHCQATGTNTWRTTTPVNKSKIAKLSVAVTDLVGNHTTEHREYKAGNTYFDANDENCTFVSNGWTTVSNDGWNLDSKTTAIAQSDSAQMLYSFNLNNSGMHNYFLRFPAIDDAADSIKVELHTGDNFQFRKVFSSAPDIDKWIYIGTADINAPVQNQLSVVAYAGSIKPKKFAIDVLKVSDLVRDKELRPEVYELDFQLVSKYETAYATLTIQNNGIESVSISEISSVSGLFNPVLERTITIEPMSNLDIPVKFLATETGIFQDTIKIVSDDPINPVQKVVCRATVENPFSLVDNENLSNYNEFGDWRTSNTQAYGESSRYAYLNHNPLNYAQYNVSVKYNGIYQVYVMLPKSENSTDNAKYTLYVNGNEVKNAYLDQNYESPEWKFLFTQMLNIGETVTLQVMDDGTSSAGAVIRADAVKFSLVHEISGVEEEAETPTEYKLLQNYPNPFNPATTISYQLPEDTHVEIYIYDLLGRKTAALINENKKAGSYTLNFNAAQYSSGVYFYTIKAGKFTQTRKMVLLK